MDRKNSQAYKGLNRIPELLDFEILISRPGVSDPDSSFIWASTFMAPEGFVFLEGQMFMNLFLPEGSENDPEKKIFLNRVNAKLQDGLWQVRRRMDQLKGKYGGPMQFAISNFRTTIVDRLYIKNGRNYGHLLMNHTDFETFSKMLLTVRNQMPDIKIEYFRRAEWGMNAYLIPGLEKDLSFVTVEFARSGSNESMGGEDQEFFFVLANFVEEGVKAISLSSNGKIPELLKPGRVANPGGNVYTFRSNNAFILSLVRAIANQYVVVFGSFGTITSRKTTLTVALPSEQVQAFIRVLAGVKEEVRECDPVVTEIMSLKDFQ